jgi:L-cysteine:1D-myo-inositol 2-amino-2-deoxy-alpha-D-glucopyranoside ligase
VSNGAVYFDVSSFKRFGQVSHLPREEMLRLAAERGGNVDDPNKRDPLDFVLWQPSAEDEPSWESLWGPGRPGWHIECSALALRELDTTIDLHGGGSDLIFPHHECEAAQSEAATGQPFVRHWMHQAMVRMDGEKMSKSLGNLVFVSDLLKTYDARAIRLACVSHHYRDSWEYDDSLMPANADRLDRWLAAAASPSARRDADVLAEVRAALDDDLDTPRAVAALDAAAADGADPTEGAALLGVLLS